MSSFPSSPSSSKPPVLNVELLNLKAIEPHRRGLFRQRFAEKNLATAHSLSFQLRALVDVIPKTGLRNPFVLTVTDVATAFGLFPSQVTRLITQEEKIEKGIPLNPSHRPRKISSEQLEKVKEFIKIREAEKEPPEPSEVCAFLENNFGISYHRNWVNTMVSEELGIFLVDASPLEQGRIDVSEEDLTKNHAAALEKLKDIDARFLINIDECGWGKKLKTGKKRVLSLSPSSTTYREKVEEGHITIIPVSYANGDFARSMIVIQTKSIERKLKPFGLPDGENVLVVASEKGYVTEELFLKLLHEIVIPSVNDRRSKYNLPRQRALLLLDGATQHTSPVIQSALEKENIGVHFLHPHSSHITQPLDCLFFSVLKTELKKVRKPYEGFSKASIRLLHGISALSKTIGWFLGLQTWKRAGFIVSLEFSTPSFTYDLSVILSRDNAPENAIKEKATKEKRKREKVFFSESKKRQKKSKKEKSEENTSK